MPPSTPHTQSPLPICFTPYGHSGGIGDAAIATGFNGVPFDIHANCYHLGQGYRAFFPGLMRFSSPDSLSPFGLGGLNAYAYCKGDPVNYGDPQGTHRVLSWLLGNTRRSDKVTARGQFDIGKTSHEVKSKRINLRNYQKMEQKHKQTQAQGVDLALDLLEHEPDLFNGVTKHLKKWDFHSAARTNPGIQEKLIKASTRAFKDHMTDILAGRARRYADDFSLTDTHFYSLNFLDTQLINAYAPYPEGLSAWYRSTWLSHDPLSGANGAIREAELFLNGGNSIFSR